MSLDLLNESMEDWNSTVAAAEEMMPIIGRLFREKSVETSIFGRLLNNRTVINIIKCCRFARQVENEDLSAEEARDVLLEVAKLDLNPCHVDLGKLAVNFRRLGAERSLTDYVGDELKGPTEEAPAGEKNGYSALWFWSNRSTACTRIDREIGLQRGDSSPRDRYP